MLSEKDLETAVESILKRFDAVNLLFIKKVASQVKQIGEFTQSSINRLTVMANMRADIKTVTAALADATKMSIVDVHTLYRKAAQDTYTDPRFTSAYVDNKPPADAQERAP